jgi:chromosome segregation ATPase
MGNDSETLQKILMVITEMRSEMQEMKSRLDTIEGRLDTIEGRLDTIEGRLDTIEGRLDTMAEEIHEIRVIQDSHGRTLAELREGVLATKRKLTAVGEILR